MENNNKTKEQLFKEIDQLRVRIAELEKSEIECKQVGELLKNQNENYAALNEELTASEEEIRAANEELVSTSDALKESNNNLIIAKEKVEESEAKYKKLSDLTFEGIIIHNKGVAVDVNLSLVKMFGYTHEELLGKNLIKFLISEKYHGIISENIIKDYAFPYEVEGIKKDGSTLPIEIEARIFFAKKDNTFRVTAIRDITERKQALEVLKKTEKNYQDLFNNASEAIYIQDRESRFIDVNQGAVDMYGYPKEFFIGKTPEFLSAPEKNDMKEIMGFVEDAFNGKSRQYDFWGIRKNGEIFPKIVRSQKASFQGQNVIITFAIDITERKKTEEALRESEEKYRTLVEDMEDVIVSFSLDGTILYCSPNVKKFGGYEAEEEIGHHFSRYIANENKQQLQALFQEIIKTKKTVSFEFLYKPKSKEPFYVEATANPNISEISNAIVSIQCIVRDITKRKQAEIALRESEEKFREMADLLPEVVYECDAHGNLTFVNRVAFDKFGYTQKDLDKGVNALQFIAPDDRKRARDNIEKILCGIEKGHFEYIAQRKDSFEFPIIIYSSPIIRDGKPVGLRGIIVDITEHKKTEDEIRENEEKYRAIVENSHDAIYIYKDKTFLFVNDKACELSGYNKEEFYEMIIWDLLHPDDRKKIEEYGRKRIAGEEVPDTYSARIIVKNGDVRNCEFAVRMIHYKNDFAILGAIQDITKHKQAEKALQESEKQLKTLIDTMPDFVCFKDGNGCWIKANDAGIRIFQLEGIDYRGKKDSELAELNSKLQDSFLTCKESDTEAWKEGSLVHGEETIADSNGSVRIYDVAKVPIFYPSGDRKGLVILGHDITERKKAEKDLIAALKKAEENDRLKTAFLLNMSHEIRTPMNGIIGFAKLLQKPGISSEKLNHFTNIIVDSSDQLLHIVNDILDISKIETGQIDLFEEEISVNKIISETFSFFELKAKEKNLKLNVFKGLSDKEATIKTDQSKLKQVLFNLVSNAFKFTEKGSIDFGYKIKGSQLEFFVKDSGIGIPKKYHKDIFDRFNKAENNSTKLFGGTGLGLSICKGLVEKIGGSIWVESDLDRHGKAGGAEFYFTIPYKTSTQTKVSKLQENITESDLADYTILVVEDETNSAIYLREILSNRKIKQLLAKDGKQAVEMFNENPDIDLILMDIKLPVMDGYTATREIKKIKSDIPVIAQTAYAMFGDKEKALKAGCDDYIAKPISEENLISLLEKYLKK
ncbi:MAG: PAS domain S-box protein [Bacteroidales bacterium]|nr:PAS domain S-box protein [Bacteroidales bacterium]